MSQTFTLKRWEHGAQQTERSGSGVDSIGSNPDTLARLEAVAAGKQRPRFN
jgi:hypothetical protein